MSAMRKSGKLAGQIIPKPVTHAFIVHRGLNEVLTRLKLEI